MTAVPSGGAGGGGGHDAELDAGHDSAWMVEEASLVLVEVTLDAVAQMGDLSLTALRLPLAADRHGPLSLSRLAAQLGRTIRISRRKIGLSPYRRRRERPPWPPPAHFSADPGAEFRTEMNALASEQIPCVNSCAACSCSSPTYRPWPTPR
ncbi:hypothetical protein [Spongiactinospora gelatinilytica]|uniref:hypothetical protein n=1 Tax=Spongiactinospora gelatinilytica TaxID=2666298 RepID=UPI0018F2CA24|nr:hypothetical protein [Spongiactinospora gelatinilytica]